MSDSTPTPHNRGLIRSNFIEAGMIMQLPMMIASFRENRRPFDGARLMERIKNNDAPKWLLNAHEELHEITCQYLPSPESLSDNASLIGFFEHMLKQNIDDESLNDFSETDEAQKFMSPFLGTLIDKGDDESMSLTDLTALAKKLYKEQKDQGNVNVDLSDVPTLQKVTQAQLDMQKSHEKAKSQPQTPSALIAIMEFFLEIEEGQFRSVDAFYRFCEDERKKEGKPLKFSEHTLRKVCTKIGLIFQKQQIRSMSDDRRYR